MVMLGVGQVVFGPVSDRVGRRPVPIGGALLFAAASFGLAASSTALPFVAWRVRQTAVALYFRVQSLIVSSAGTLAVIGLQGDTAWPLAAYASAMAIVVLTALGCLRARERRRA